MSSWDDEDFDVPTTAANGAVPKDRWEGEDEEVADAWDDEDEDEKKTSEGAATASSKPRRRNLQEIIAEKEAKRQQELAAKKAELAEREKTELTPEQIRMAQEESDLMLAKEAFGVSEAPVLTEFEREKSIDAARPQSKEDFDKLRGLLRDKLLPFEKSPHFAGFLDSLLRELTTNQDVETLKRLSNMLAAMANEKVKQQRGKSKKKGAGKGKLATIRDNDFQNDATAGPEIDDFDDFM